jgi:N-acetylneuraminate synthase
MRSQTSARRPPDPSWGELYGQPFCDQWPEHRPDHPTYVIAEVSANHNQSFDAAVRLIHAAAEAGADAVKLQTYTPDTLTIRSDRPAFRVSGGTLWDGKTLYDLYAEAYTPWEWQPKLKDIAEQLGLDLFSTPFDHTAVEFLEEMNVAAYKVASFELVDIPLIERIAATGKPMIISTGMATLVEITEAVGAARRLGNEQIALLKCTSAYPAPASSMNLRTIPHLASTLSVPVGVSDHTWALPSPQRRLRWVLAGRETLDEQSSRTRPGQRVFIGTARI